MPDMIIIGKAGGPTDFSGADRRDMMIGDLSEQIVFEHMKDTIADRLLLTVSIYL